MRLRAVFVWVVEPEREVGGGGGGQVWVGPVGVVVQDASCPGSWYIPAAGLSLVTERQREIRGLMSVMVPNERKSRGIIHYISSMNSV